MKIKQELIVKFKAPPTPKTISAQVHADPMKFSGYVGTEVERLW
jgi:hypothetical protein